MSKKENNKKGNRDKNIHADYTDVDITDGRKAGLGRQRRISAEPMSKFNLDAMDKERKHDERTIDIQCRTNRRRRAAFTKRLEDKGESQQSRCPNSIWTQ